MNQRIRRAIRPHWAKQKTDEEVLLELEALHQVIEFNRAALDQIEQYLTFEHVKANKIQIQLRYFVQPIKSGIEA